MNRLSAGTARATITPPVGVDLCGYAGRPSGSTGVHDDLFAKALVLSDGDLKAAIVTLDLVGLSAEQVAWIRQTAGARTGIPRENMLIGASHTHSGPAPHLIRGCGKPDEGYVQDLLNRIVCVIEAAASDLRPVKFGFGSGQADIAVNRRYHTPSGEVQIGENPGGAVDTEVGIWHFADGEGRSLATVFNYACHAVVLDGGNLLVSSDWPGSAQRAIETEVGGQAMFLQGCCGNINPRERGSFVAMEKLGAEVGNAVTAVLPGIPMMSEAHIDIASQVIHLPLQAPPTVDEAERVVREMTDSLEKSEDSPSLAHIHICRAYLEWALNLISQGCRGSETVQMEIQRISLGGAHIIALPGEVFVEYALRLKQAARNVMVAGYANGNVGYVPTRRAFDEGGYEVEVAYKLYGEQMLTRDVEDTIIKAAGQLL